MKSLSNVVNVIKNVFKVLLKITAKNTFSDKNYKYDECNNFYKSTCLKYLECVVVKIYSIFILVIFLLAVLSLLKLFNVNIKIEQYLWE